MYCSRVATPPVAPGGPAYLYAYNALAFSQNLFLGTAVSSDQTSGAVKFQIPTMANGHVFVGGCVTNADPNTNGLNSGNMPCLDGQGTLTVFGLMP